MNVFLFISVALIFTFALGRLLERAHVPWVFSALIFGAGLALYDPFKDIVGSETFDFLARLGMYFLLFIVGLEIDIKKLKHQGMSIIRIAFVTLIMAIILGMFVLKYYFDISWLVAVLVALSFATVGEAILAPILDKLNIVNTKIGQGIIGIGTLDDAVEIIALVFVTFVIGSHAGGSIEIVLLSLFALTIMTFGFTWLDRNGHKFRFSNVQTLFLMIMIVFFLFVGIGEYADAAPLAALLAGVSLRTFVVPKRLGLVESEIKALTYGLFAPIFFIWIGESIDIASISENMFLIAVVVIVSALSKIASSIIARGDDFNIKESLLLGIGLSVRFSTGIIIMKIFLDSGLIDDRLYSVIISSSVIFTLLVPMVFSRLLYRWRNSINV